MKITASKKGTSKPKNDPVRIGMMSLGCPKTLVDSELILGKLDPSHYQIVPTVSDCDVALLNTCSFIREAQQESVDRILELVELKKEKQIKAIVVMGCLVQEFPGDLKKELKEVDAFIGSGEYQKIPGIIEKVTSGKKVFSVGTPGYLYTSGEARVALTPRHYRYVKISEGCDHECSFCTIPTFRGKHRSRPIEDILIESKRLIQEGARELILTGQDTSYFGRDFSGKFLLSELLNQVDQLEGIEWVRLLYAYPSCLTKELMTTIRNSKHICHYLDMPLQHASDRMLTAMRRGITKRRTTDLINQFRDIVPDLAIRTTMIVGFPGETEKDFEELMDFANTMKFERLGVFKYSREEGSHAASLPDQVDEAVKESRYHQLMQLQQKIAQVKTAAWVGKSLKVVIEEKDPKKAGEWLGRSFMDAPEIDGNVLIKSQKPLTPGQFYTVQIEAANDYDLVGKL